MSSETKFDVQKWLKQENRWYYSEMVCQDQYECLRFLEQTEDNGFDIKSINIPNRYPGTVVVYSRVINKKEPEKVSE